MHRVSGTECQTPPFLRCRPRPRLGARVHCGTLAQPSGAAPVKSFVEVHVRAAASRPEEFVAIRTLGAYCHWLVSAFCRSRANRLNLVRDQIASDRSGRSSVKRLVARSPSSAGCGCSLERARPKRPAGRDRRVRQGSGCGQDRREERCACAPGRPARPRTTASTRSIGSRVSPGICARLRRRSHLRPPPLPPHTVPPYAPPTGRSVRPT